MCHQDSIAPSVPSSVLVEQQTTPTGIPLLSFSTREHDDDDQLPVVLATDIYGVTPFYKHVAGLLAAAGHRAVVPDLFFRVGAARDSSREANLERRAKLDDTQVLTDLRDTVTTCHSGQGRYAVIGFCLGGTLALLSAAEDPQQDTVTFYAFPRVVPGGASPPLPEPIAVADRIQGSVLAFWGRKDYIDPAEISELQVRLAAAPGSTEVHLYDDGGHSFLAGLTEKSSNTAAATDAWQRTLLFLQLAPTKLSQR